jgi:RNA polymerase sigma factor (sigma-70 family)
MLSSRTDAELVALTRGGSDRAFEALAARYRPRLLRFCGRLLRSPDDAEDALQDVFISAYRALLADDRALELRPWLYRIARNRCINELRRAATIRFEQLADEHPGSQRAVVDMVASREQLRDLVDDVQALPNTQGTALLLREIDGFAYQQIAAAMDTTIPAVKSLLVRARAGLRNASSAGDVTPPRATIAARSGRGRPPAGRAARGPSYRAARAAASA